MSNFKELLGGGRDSKFGEAQFVPTLRFLVEFFLDPVFLRNGVYFKRISQNLLHAELSLMNFARTDFPSAPVFFCLGCTTSSNNILG